MMPLISFCGGHANAVPAVGDMRQDERGRRMPGAGACKPPRLLAEKRNHRKCSNSKVAFVLGASVEFFVALWNGFAVRKISTPAASQLQIVTQVIRITQCTTVTIVRLMVFTISIPMFSGHAYLFKQEHFNITTS